MLFKQSFLKSGYLSGYNRKRSVGLCKRFNKKKENNLLKIKYLKYNVTKQNLKKNYMLLYNLYDYNMYNSNVIFFF